MQEIIQITTEIETDYPELYRYLEETPLFLGNVKEGNVNSKDLEYYLETLKTQLYNHIKTH